MKKRNQKEESSQYKRKDMDTTQIPNCITFPDVSVLVDAFNRRFPDGNTPFQMVSRIGEEIGEIAEQINILEEQNQQQVPQDQRFQFTKEIEDTLRATLTIARYYHVEPMYQTFDEVYVVAKTFCGEHPTISKNALWFVSSLTEALGKLSKKVNHAEGMGIKTKKYGDFDPQTMFNDVDTLIIISFAIIQHYCLENDLQASFQHSFRRMTELGFIPTSK